MSTYKSRLSTNSYDFRGHLDSCNSHVAEFAPFNSECNCGYAQFKQSLDMGFMLEMTGEEQTAALVRWREAVLGALAKEPSRVTGYVLVDKNGALVASAVDDEPVLYQSPPLVQEGKTPPYAERTTSPGLESDGGQPSAAWTSGYETGMSAGYADGYSKGHEAGYKQGQREIVERIDNWFKGR